MRPGTRILSSFVGPHSGPSRAERGKEILATSQAALRGYQGAGPHRHVELWNSNGGRGFGKFPERGVRDDPHDGQPAGVHGAESLCHARADRILVGEVDANERLVDDGDRLAPVDVAAFEAAAAEKRRAHRLEVGVRDCAECDDRRYGAFWIRLPLHTNEATVSSKRVGERDAGRRGGARHARKCGQSIEDGLMSHDGCGCGRILAVGQADAKRDCRGRIEPRVDRAQVLEAADHETAAMSSTSASAVCPPISR